MNLILSFVLLFLACEIVLTLVQFLLRRRKVKTGVHVALGVVKALVAAAFAGIVMAGPVVLRPVQPFMMAAYVALLSDAAADLCYTIICATRKKERKFSTVKTLSLVFGAVFLAYGILNMQIVLPKYHTYTSEKLMRAHKVIFAADMHVGSAQSFEVTAKTVAAMQTEQPDCIILGGDIMDDYTTKEEMENTFALFKDSACPVYYVYGNHDLQGHAEYAIGLQYTKDEFEQALTQNGIQILADDYADLAPDLLLLGREDFTAGEGRADAATLQNPAPEKYLIVADHQPTGAKDNLKTGMDLQLSGHTHAGQLFPLKALYALIGGYVYGDYHVGAAVMNVSAGVCGWRMPLRTDAHCNFEVVTLLPLQQ